METQVLCGILPISRVSAVPACIHAAARLLPLERILRLAHPAAREPPEADKRTWREGTKPREDAPAKERVWTAMDVLTAYAEKKGWVTAKAGRPDVNRAGNASAYIICGRIRPCAMLIVVLSLVLRALAEGRIRWAFWPPGAAPDVTAADLGHGVWIEGEDAGMTDDESGDGEEDEKRAGAESDGDARSDEGDDDSDEDEEDDKDDAEAEAAPVAVASTGGRYGALTIDDASEEEEDSDESE